MRDEALSDGGAGALVGRAPGEERVEHVVGLAAEAARGSARRPPSGPSIVAKKRNGVTWSAMRAPVAQSRRMAPAELVVATRCSARPQAALPRPIGEAHQPVLVEPDQRALQERRELQVVFGQEHRVGERQEVERGDVGRHGTRSGAGDGDLRCAQRPVHRGDERVAPAHQHQDAAGVGATLPDGSGLPRIRP